MQYVIIAEAVTEFTIHARDARDAIDEWRRWVKEHPRLRRGPLRVQLILRKHPIVLDSGRRQLPVRGEVE